MDVLINRLESALKQGKVYLNSTDHEALKFKPAPHRWSKQEILGHLIDSATHNLITYAEIQFKPQPYLRAGYPQDELVRAHNYQDADIQDLTNLWLALNKRIRYLLKRLSPNVRQYKVIYNDEETDLRFWIEDYVSHLEHHVRQISTN